MPSKPSPHVSQSLEAWQFDRQLAVRLFGEEAAAKLDAKRRFALPGSTVVLGSYENPWGRAGGLYSVVCRLASEYGKLKTSDGSPFFHEAFVVTPYHVGLRIRPDPCPTVAQFDVPFEDRPHRVEMHRAEAGGVVWYLIRAEGFFAAEGGRARSNPYLYAADAAGGHDLLRDGLFFSKAIPRAVAALGFRERVLFHLQDWQTGLVALTGKECLLADDSESLRSAAFVFTQHNPYDQVLNADHWRRLTDRPAPQAGDFTVQDTALRLIDAPPTVVSQTFARELTTDTLHTCYFARHLQEVLLRGVVGVDNGPFVDAPPPADSDVVTAKQAARTAMLAALEEFQRNPPRDPEVRGEIHADERNSSPADLDPRVPVFAMSGRLDQRQKGFDILAAAIGRMLEHDPWGSRYILMPDPGDTPEPFVEQLRSVAARHPGRVLLVLGRMPLTLFKAVQAGSTWSVWPSIYEPFGGVSEYTLVGTPCIARRTGGLMQQVTDHPTDGDGITYTTSQPETREEWAAFLDADPEDRARSSCGRSHISALCAALARAGETFADDDAYRRMLENLRKPDDRFSWDRAVAEYLLVFERAVQ